MPACGALRDTCSVHQCLRSPRDCNAEGLLREPCIFELVAIDDNQSRSLAFLAGTDWRRVFQTADTVIMYDPDANPKNEEQAVARSHRIGQTKPVRVIHLEAVADATPDATTADYPDYQGDAEGVTAWGQTIRL